MGLKSVLQREQRKVQPTNLYFTRDRAKGRERRKGQEIDQTPKSHRKTAADVSHRRSSKTKLYSPSPNRSTDVQVAAAYEETRVGAETSDCATVQAERGPGLPELSAPSQTIFSLEHKCIHNSHHGPLKQEGTPGSLQTKLFMLQMEKWRARETT